MAENESNNEQAAATDQAGKPHFGLQRIYLKDMSFESPMAPLVFQEKWAPQVKMDVNTEAKKIQDNIYEVVLSITVTVSSNDKTIYLAEVQQAGVFSISGLEEAPLRHTIGAFCPNMLFPYARETIDNLATRGGFPALHLAPINFDAVFAEAMKNGQKPKEGEGEGDAASVVTH